MERWETSNRLRTVEKKWGDTQPFGHGLGAAKACHIPKEEQCIIRSSSPLPGRWWEVCDSSQLN